MHDEDELAASLTGLAGRLAEPRSLEQGPVRVAQFAVGAIPGADGVGLTRLQANRPRTMVATDPFVTHRP